MQLGSFTASRKSATFRTTLGINPSCIVMSRGCARLRTLFHLYDG